MKFSENVTSSRRKNRKAHFSATSHERRVLMSAALSKDLRAKHSVRSMPVRKDDEVEIVRGKYKAQKGLITAVYRKKFVIHVASVVREKGNGQSVPIAIQPSNCVIQTLKMDKSRQLIIDRKAAPILKKKNAMEA